MLDKKIAKMYLEAYRKAYYNNQLNNINKAHYYAGQCSLLEKEFSEYLSEKTIADLKLKAESLAEGDLHFYSD